MKEIKILYLSSGTADSEMTGNLNAGNLNAMETCTIITKSICSANVNHVMIMDLLTKHDILIFDGTIEDDAELNNAKYDFLDPFILLQDNFFVVTRNTLPMNLVPPHSNLNQFNALRNNMYQIDRNRLDDSSVGGTVSNEGITSWVQQEIKKFLTIHKDYNRPETSLDVLENLKKDVTSVMAQTS